MPATKKGKDPETKTISTIETTFGSRWTDLGKIIVNLERMGKQYNPPNQQITIPMLKELHLKMDTTNILAAQNNAALKIATSHRKKLFVTLEVQMLAIKKLISSQFGSDSENYQKLKNII